MKSWSHDHWGPLVVAFYTPPTFSWKLYLAVFHHRTPGSSLSTLWSLGFVDNFTASVPLLNIKWVKLNVQKAIGYMVPSYYQSLCKQAELNYLNKLKVWLQSETKHLSASQKQSSISQSQPVGQILSKWGRPQAVTLPNSFSVFYSHTVYKCSLFTLHQWAV